MSKQGVATIGTKVSVNEVEMNYVTQIGALGGNPSTLDATTMKDRIRKNVPGVQDAGSFEVNYLYDNSAADSDFRKLKALETAGNAVPVEVELPDGTKMATEAYVHTHVTEAGVDQLLSAEAVFTIQEEWSVTNPSASSGSSGN